jgi:3-oxoacyl-[acyl-carrier protein] reductase
LKAVQTAAAVFIGSVSPIVCDVRDYEGLRSAYARFSDSGGRPLNYLVNCAGVNAPTGLARSTISEWEAVVSTNLTGTYLSCKAAVELLAVGGAIVNISSTQAHLGGRSAQYAAAKAGVEGMSKSIARELAPRGIRVNCVAPGASETGMASTWDDATRVRLSEQALLGRISQPSEISAAILFLLFETASYVTGSVLHVNGGAYMN